MSTSTVPYSASAPVKIELTKKTDEIEIEIETARLYIRNYRDEDFKHSVTLYTHPDLTKYFDSGKPKSIQEIEELVSNYRRLSENELLGLFSVFEKEKMSFVGHIDLAPSNYPGLIEIGYIFNQNFHNRGFCTEAVRAILFDYINHISKTDYRLSKEPIQGVVATVHPENISSQKILQKMGMAFERFLQRFNNPRYEYRLTYQ